MGIGVLNSIGGLKYSGIGGLKYCGIGGLKYCDNPHHSAGVNCFITHYISNVFFFLPLIFLPFPHECDVVYEF